MSNPHIVGNETPAVNERGAERFPLSAMSGVAKEFAETYAAHLEPPAEFFYMSFLTCLGNMISGRVSIDSEISPDPRLYTLILGESADDRKSTAIKRTVQMFDDTINTCDGVGSAEGLALFLADYNNTILVLDEFKALASKAKIESSTLLECLASLFEHNRYSNRVKKDPISVSNAHLSMLAASTLNTYENTWDPKFSDIGLSNRLFVVPGTATRKDIMPAVIPDEKKRLFKREIEDINGFVGQYIKFKVSKEAHDISNYWYAVKEKTEHARRLEGYLLRIAIIIAANEFKDTIDDVVITRAMQICDWQLHIRKLYAPVEGDSKIAIMEGRIRKVLEGRAPRPTTERHLKQFCNAKRSGVFVFESALKNLRRAGEISYSSHGRSIRWFIVNDNDRIDSHPEDDGDE